MSVTALSSASNLIRKHAIEAYLSPARRRGDKTFSVNVGLVHKALGLRNRVPLVVAALGSKKFMMENHLRLISKTGPPSGQSTTVTYTYAFSDKAEPEKGLDRQDAWKRLRGALKDVFDELGGGENYLRNERANFYGSGKDR